MEEIARIYKVADGTFAWEAIDQGRGEQNFATLALCLSSLQNFLSGQN